MLALWSKGLHERSQITSKPSSSNFVKCLEDSAHVLTFPAPAPGKQAGPSLGCKAVAASMIGRKRCSEISASTWSRHRPSAPRVPPHVLGEHLAPPPNVAHECCERPAAVRVVFNCHVVLLRRAHLQHTVVQQLPAGTLCIGDWKIGRQAV